MGDQAILRRLIILTILLSGWGVAQTPYNAPKLRTDQVKSFTPSLPVSVEDSSRFYFFFEIMGADTPDTPIVVAVRVWYDSASGHLMLRTPWGGLKYLDSLSVAPASDTALFAYDADSARASHISDTAKSVDWADVANAPAIGDSVRASWKADSSGKADTARSAGAAPWAGITGKPATFPPDAHTHDSVRAAFKADSAGKADTARSAGVAASVPWGGVTSAPDSFRAAWKADSAGDVEWANISSKPATFTPASHSHPQAEVTALAETLATRLYATDTTKFRENSDYKYQPKSIYMVPSDSGLQRTYSDYLYQAKGTYLTPADSTEQRAASAALYQPIGSYQPAGTYLVPSDSTEGRSNSNFLYQPKDADLTTYAGITPSANVQTLLGSATFADFNTSLGLGTGNSPTFTGATLSGMTAGSVLFAGVSGALSQDNANLFWDNTNNRLGIGLTNPARTLAVQAATTPGIQLKNSDVGGAAGAFLVSGTSVNFQSDNAAATRFLIDVSGGASGAYVYLNAKSDGTIRLATGGTERAHVNASGNFGLGLTSFGTSAEKVFALSSGTAPTTSPADAIQMWSADRGATAGKAGLHIRSEDGTSHVFSDLVGIGSVTPTAMLDVNSDILRLRTAKTPASASAAGNAGDICWDANYIYVCVATNTWKRVAIATW